MYSGRPFNSNEDDALRSLEGKLSQMNAYLSSIQTGKPMVPQTPPFLYESQSPQPQPQPQPQPPMNQQSLPSYPAPVYATQAPLPPPEAAPVVSPPAKVSAYVDEQLVKISMTYLETMQREYDNLTVCCDMLFGDPFIVRRALCVRWRRKRLHWPRII